MINQKYFRHLNIAFKAGLLSLFIFMFSSLSALAVTDEVVDSASLKSTTTADKEANTEAVKVNENNEEINADDSIVVDESAHSEATKPEVNNPPVAGNITEKDTVIKTSINQVNDSDIEKRIKGILSEIEGLKSITVAVNQGVVSLSGEVPNEKKAQQAINLANRVSEVVAVEDRISRTLDVQENVTPVITDLKHQTQELIKATPLLLVAILVFAFVVWFGAWFARRESFWRRVSPNVFVAELLSQTVKVIFIVIGLILALSFMGAEAIIGSLLGGAGVIGIAVGFAVKDTIENYIASLMLSVRQPFMARDFVRINDKEGIVVRLTSRATILMTPDGNQLRIPNSEVFKASILNYTKNPERRFDFKLGVDANDDPLAAIKVGLEAVNSLDFVLKTPQAVCIITEVGDSNIVLEFQLWVNQTHTDLYKARSIAIREAKHALEDKGFSLPEPIYKVRFDDDVETAIMHLNQVDLSRRESPDNKDTLIENQQVGVATETEEQTTFNKAESHSRSADKEDKDKPEKLKAKRRAQQILGNQDAEDVLDARPDPKLMQKVEEEIREDSGNTDLLDCNSPQE